MKIQEVKQECIQLEVVVNEPLELEHLKMDVESGAFLNRHVSWIKKNGGEVKNGEKIEVKVFQDRVVVASYEKTITENPLKGKFQGYNLK